MATGRQITTKSILLRIVGDLEELRANQLLLAGQLGVGISPIAAADSLSAAKREIAPIYDAFRKEVEKLP
jgi:hypothetical protein